MEIRAEGYTVGANTSRGSPFSLNEKQHIVTAAFGKSKNNLQKVFCIYSNSF